MEKNAKKKWEKPRIEEVKKIKRQIHMECEKSYIGEDRTMAEGCEGLCGHYGYTLT